MEILARGELRTYDVHSSQSLIREDGAESESEGQGGGEPSVGVN